MINNILNETEGIVFYSGVIKEITYSVPKTLDDIYNILWWIAFWLFLIVLLKK